MKMETGRTIQRIRRLLNIIMFMLVGIGLATVVRRVLLLTGVIRSINPSGGAPFDSGFGQHPVVTLIHILPGVLFMLLGPLQFMPGIRNRYTNFHRVSGYVFIFSSYLVGISALCLPFVMSPIGGVNEAAASLLYGCFFLIALSLAWRAILLKNLALHRRWMIRAFSIGLGISTVRPIMGLFFAFSGLPPQVFFGTAFWIGFTLHLVVAEVWINLTSPVRGHRSQ